MCLKQPKIQSKHAIMRTMKTITYHFRAVTENIGSWEPNTIAAPECDIFLDGEEVGSIWADYYQGKWEYSIRACGRLAEKGQPLHDLWWDSTDYPSLEEARVAFVAALEAI